MLSEAPEWVEKTATSPGYVKLSYKNGGLCGKGDKQIESIVEVICDEKALVCFDI